MYKSIFVILTVFTSAMNLNVSAADKSDVVLNPMVLIELSADMKADWLYSERMLAVEIKDELMNKQRFSNINRDYLPVQRARTVLAYTNTSVFAGNAKRLHTAD
ncbi:MAG: hypothetical protein COA74_15015 [Gammaproteobacteria bacterium]|nr:MAG: hypothetical protein COA74_15015 [Gammaproteobacteria bacterium]